MIFIGLAILGLDHPVTAIIDGAGAFVGAALAFLVAPFLFKLDRSQVEQVLQKLDESEGKFNNTSSQHSEKKQIVEEKNEPTKEEQEESKPEEDWRSGIDKYLDK